jgi:hypothetical protein
VRYGHLYSAPKLPTDTALSFKMNCLGRCSHRCPVRSRHRNRPPQISSQPLASLPMILVLPLPRSPLSRLQRLQSPVGLVLHSPIIRNPIPWVTHWVLGVLPLVTRPELLWQTFPGTNRSSCGVRTSVLVCGPSSVSCWRTSRWPTAWQWRSSFLKIQSS